MAVMLGDPKSRGCWRISECAAYVWRKREVEMPRRKKNNLGSTVREAAGRKQVGHVIGAKAARDEVNEGQDRRKPFTAVDLTRRRRSQSRTRWQSQLQSRERNRVSS